MDFFERFDHKIFRYLKKRKRKKEEEKNNVISTNTNTNTNTNTSLVLGYLGYYCIVKIYSKS